MKIIIVGLGYVGATAAACLASQGHCVVGVDLNEEKVRQINAGLSPFVESSVERLISESVSEGRLRAVGLLPALDDIDLILVCVGTPSRADGSHNMSAIVESTRQIAVASRSVRREVTVAYRSTFKPGTVDGLILPLFEDQAGPDFRDRIEVVYNPEFLRESSAVNDFFYPPKVVVGTENARPSERMRELHRDLQAPVFETGFREAEITKLIDNTWHATKVVFANEVGRICAAYGVDSKVAHEIFVSDTKLNISPYYTRPGGAFGGSCLPKDVRAMEHLSHSAGSETPLVASLLASNEAHKDFQLDRVRAVAPAGSRLLVAGIAFKYGTDDLRESPHVRLVADLIRSGYMVRVFDPGVTKSRLLGQNLAAVLGEIPSFHSVLIAADEVSNYDHDYVVINNDSVNELPLVEHPVVDLRVIHA